MNAKISVLMSIYKEPIEWIEQSIRSILNQTYKNLEIVLISDNPESSELTDYLKWIEQNDSRVIVSLNGENIGLVASLNRGLKICTGEYVARMDADDISLPNRIEKQLAFMTERNYDLVGCQFCVFNSDTDLYKSEAPIYNDACQTVLKYKSCIAHPSWLVKKSVYDKLNGYRNIDACEDLDFLQRVVFTGYKVGNCPEILLRYRDNQNSISHKKEYRQMAIRRIMARALYKNEILSEETYQAYLLSDRYQSDTKKFEKIAKLDNCFKSEKNGIKKGRALIQLLTEPIYVEEKIWNLKINRAIQRERASNEKCIS